MQPSARSIWRFAAPVYCVSAIVLIPWIIGLAAVQPRTGLVYHLDWVGLGVVVLLMAGALITGALCLRHSRLAALTATFMATVAFVAAWFSVLALIHHTKTLIIAWLIFAPLTCLMAWVAVRVVRSRDTGWNVPRWVIAACFAFSAPGVLWIFGAPIVDAVVYGNRLSSVVEARQLRVAWSGLDLFELAAMLVTAYCIRRGSPWMVIAATVVAGLLCCDAWIDITTSSGLDQALGIALAFIELPLAAYSLALAAREARSWGRRAMAHSSAARSG
ncbi:MAG TPA: hypothetical protein VHI51_21870 [Ktedonobacterales bacterium]|jgi:hypothetical protein|nr:hypothetical protein [Ktedonobacterales bacterium]